MTPSRLHSDVKQDECSTSGLAEEKKAKTLHSHKRPLRLSSNINQLITKKICIYVYRTNRCCLGIQTHGQYCGLPPCHEAWCIAGKTKKRKTDIIVWLILDPCDHLDDGCFHPSYWTLKPRAADRVKMSLYAILKTLDYIREGSECAALKSACLRFYLVNLAVSINRLKHFKS